MAIIHRRVFQARVGQSAPLVEHFLEAVNVMKSHGINWDTRISSDYYSGRSDRDSVEWLLDELSDIDAINLIKKDSIFVATGVTDGDFVKGIKEKGDSFTSETLVLHQSSNTNKIVKNINKK